MTNNYRPVLASLYVLLFLSFVAMSLAQPVASWISTTFGGWVTAEAVAGYGIYIAGLIWLINRVNKAAGFVPPVQPAQPSRGMSESDFIRGYARAPQGAELRLAEQSSGSESGSDSNIRS